MARLFKERLYEPSPRAFAFAAPAGGRAYMWGGLADDFSARKAEMAATVEIFDADTEKWTRTLTTGSPPPVGLYGGATASDDHRIYIFGGFDVTSRHNSLHQLDTLTSDWKQLSPAHSNGGPMRKEGSRMVYYQDQLVLFGGRGAPSGCTQPGASYDGGWTNELHVFDLRKGTWSSPPVTGNRPPPCAYFSFTMMDDNQAVLFGGYHYPHGRTNDVYTLDLSNMYWDKVCMRDSDPQPTKRNSHAAVCLGYGGDHPHLLVMEGWYDSDNECLSDVWMLDLHTWKWKELSLPDDCIQARRGHCAAAFDLGPRATEIIVFGGNKSHFSNYIARSTVLLFEYHDDHSTGPGGWTLQSAANSRLIGTASRIREKKSWILASSPQQSQERVRRDLEERIRQAEARVKCLEGELRVAKGSKMATEAMLQETQRRVFELERSCEDSEQKAVFSERRAVENERRGNELRRRAVESEDRAIEMERRLEQCEQRCSESEQKASKFEQQYITTSRRAVEYEQRTSLLENQLRTSCEEQMQHRHEPYWAVNVREVQLTGPELGRGGWATVTVATFRGTQVAAKSIHNQIISQHNVRMVVREMNMAARIRHPNLLQFIGASMEGEMMILTELMPTSLRRELEREYTSMSASSVAAVSLDVARALNYLHLMQPDPMIHRDISSANVLLEPRPNGCWRAKVGDYGTVNLLRELETICPGNFIYAAPEATDPTKQSPAMDIFSFGVLLVEMLTGELPPLEERQELVTSIRHPRMLALVQRCLDRERERRPSATAIITELET